MIKMKTKGKEGRDDVSFDLDDEDREDGEMKKERVQKKRESYTEREKRMRSTRERDGRLRSMRSVNNTKADCGRG